MALYQVTTPRLFRINDPDELVGFNLNTLNASFTFPDNPFTLTYDLPIVYSSNLLLGGYIIRKTNNNPGPITDSFESASNIIQTMRKKCIGLTNFSSFPNGTSFKTTIFNNSTSDLSYVSDVGNGILVGGEKPQIAAGKTGILEIVVTGQSQLSTASSPQSDQVWICISACAGADCTDNPIAGPIEILRKKKKI